MLEYKHITACCKTDPGKKRSRNEDKCMASTTCNCFVVADGMGGVAGGDVASALFVEAASEIFNGHRIVTLLENRDRIKEVFSLADSKISIHVEEHPDHAGMGCTAEIFSLSDGEYILGHIGDSRTYCFRDNRLEQLTKDHSFVQEQMEQGLISREQVGTSKYRNVLLRAVGIDSTQGVDVLSGQVSPGDIFLLCSDGLYNMLTVDDIVAVLAYDGELSLKADILVNMANDAGGFDNISVTLVEIGG